MSEGQLHLNKTSFGLDDLLQECCIHILEAGEHKLVFKGDRNITVDADEIRIGQVVNNFINNAVKYASGSKTIEIEVEKQDSDVRVSVNDQGPGIPADRLPYLFNRYFRVDNSETLYSGLGLGLYINSEIIKSHNGQIGVSSEIGRGSSFWFTLPI